MKRDQTSWILPALNAPITRESLPQVTAEELEQRYRAMKAAFGIFKDKDVFPDGLEYQLAIRAEWGD